MYTYIENKRMGLAKDDVTAKAMQVNKWLGIY